MHYAAAENAHRVGGVTGGVDRAAGDRRQAAVLGGHAVGGDAVGEDGRILDAERAATGIVPARRAAIEDADGVVPGGVGRRGGRDADAGERQRRSRADQRCAVGAIACRRDCGSGQRGAGSRPRLDRVGENAGC